MAGDVRASRASAWQSQHYTKESFSRRPPADPAVWLSGSGVSGLFPTSQLQGRWDAEFCTRESCSKGLPCVRLASFLQSLPVPKNTSLLLWRRLKSFPTAVRGRPFQGRGRAALAAQAGVPSPAALGPFPVWDSSRGAGPQGLAPPRTHPCRVAHELAIPGACPRRWSRGPRWQKWLLPWQVRSCVQGLSGCFCEVKQLFPGCPETPLFKVRPSFFFFFFSFPICSQLFPCSCEIYSIAWPQQVLLPDMSVRSSIVLYHPHCVVALLQLFS